MFSTILMCFDYCSTKVFKHWFICLHVDYTWSIETRIIIAFYSACSIPCLELFSVFRNSAKQTIVTIAWRIRIYNNNNNRFWFRSWHNFQQLWEKCILMFWITMFNLQQLYLRYVFQDALSFTINYFPCLRNYFS